MGVLPLDVGVVGLAHLVEGPPPGVVHVGQDVGLGHQVELLLFVALTGQLKRVADGPLGAEAGGAVDLGGDLLGRALVLEAAHARVEPLGVLANHDEVDVFRALVLEWTVHARIQLHWAKVDVLVHPEADAQQDTYLQRPRWHVWVADSPQVDGVEAPQLL